MLSGLVTSGLFRNRSVRPGKVAYSSGCESRSSKAGQPLDRGPWAGGSNSKGQAQGDQDNRRKRKLK